MAEEKIVITAELQDLATAPLQRLKNTVNSVLDQSISASKKVGSAMSGLAGQGQAVQNAFGKVGQGVAAMGRGVGAGVMAIGRGIGNVVTGAVKGAAVATAALTGGGIAASIQVMEKGFARVIAIQDATAQSAVLMGGDINKAKGFIEDIKEVVTGTPFSLPDFAKYGQQLLSYGASAEKIPGILKAIGEATAGNGAQASEYAGRVANAMSKMMATGKVQLEEIWTIADAGVPALTILANGFGVTSKEMQDMISEGAVPAEKAIDLLTKGIMEGTNGAAGATQAYAGSMAALRNTISGSLSVLQATKAKLGETLILPFAVHIPAAINAFGAVVKSVGIMIDPLVKQLAEMGWIQKVTAQLNDLAKAMSGSKGAAFIAELKEMAPLLAPIAAGLLAMAGGMAASIPVIGPMLASLNPLAVVLAVLVAQSPILREAFGGALKAVGDALRPLAPLFTEFMNALKATGSAIATALAPVIKELGGLLGQVLATVLTAVMKVFMALAPVVVTLVQAAVPLVTVIARFAATLVDILAPILPIIAKYLGEFATIVGSALFGALNALLPPLLAMIMALIKSLAPILPVIMSAFMNVVRAVMPLIPVATQLAMILLNLAASVLMQLLQAIMPIIPPVIRIITLFVELAVKAIMPVLPLIMRLITLLIETALKAIIPLIPPAIRIIELVLQLASSIGLQLIRMVVALMPTLIRLFEVLTPLIPPIMRIIELLLNLAIQVITPLIPLVEKVASFITTLLKGALEVTIPWIEKIIYWVGELIKWLGDKLQPVLSVVGGMFQGIAGFIGDVVKAVESFFKGAFGWVIDLFKKMTGASGGGIVVNQASGGGVVQGFAAGGVLGGYAPGVDTVPAMLSPGEAVLVPELVRAIGAANIMRANHEYSGGRPAMAGSPRMAPLGMGGGGTTINVSIGNVEVKHTDEGFDMSEFRAALENVLGTAAKRAYGGGA